MTEEFQGRKRIFVVWVQRTSLGSTDWDPIACIDRREASGEIQRALKVGDRAFVRSYQRAKRNPRDKAAERDASQNFPLERAPEG